MYMYTVITRTTVFPGLQIIAMCMYTVHVHVNGATCSPYHFTKCDESN